MKTPVLYNDDGQGIGEWETGDPRTFLREWVDQICDHVPIDTYTFLAACPDICFYQTNAGEVADTRFEEPRTPRGRTLRTLSEQGTDPLRVVVERLHERDTEALAEIRMSDTHHREISADESGCPQFTLDHPEWCITRPDGQVETAMDYSVPEVREHRLRIMQDLAEHWDVDGLELNFNRWGKHFHRDEGREKMPIMTEFVGEIRAVLGRAAARRGRSSLTLGARVPATLQECELAGLDPKSWVEYGWVDFLVAADWNATWPDLPVEQFAAFTSETSCRLYAQMGDMMGGTWAGKPDVTGRGLAYAPGRTGYGGMLLTSEEARAAARNHYAWGADGIGFWNIACNQGRGKWGHIPGQHERVWHWMNEVIDPDRVRAGARHYHFLPLYKRDRVLLRNYAWNEDLKTPTGGTRGQVLIFTKQDERGVFIFRMADGRDGEPLEGVLRFSFHHTCAEDRFDVDINGATVDSSKLQRVYDAAGDPPCTRYEIALSDCPPFRGDNELGLTWRGRGTPVQDIPYMEQLEVIVQP